ncbi:MAG TPA: hypothetical protein VL984_04420 [Acidimicrobiales bacterium]|nr:hypothetical protein [Acidimicrobiales bacterium]
MHTVVASDLVLGPMLAEGGEGRVFEVVAAPGPARQPNGPLVFKQLRRPRPIRDVEPVVDLPTQLGALDPARARRVASSSAWPVAAVVDGGPDAIGLLMPRAPAAFWLRHRDGKGRLANLSYLVSDPDRIAIAYGAQVPPPGDPERVALVYALSRLLDGWEGAQGPLRAVHGDLSAKNVLWSMVPGPAVYVLDCDGATVLGPPAPAGPGPEEVPKPRATTPNWEDPATAAGAGAGAGLCGASDRYALGLAFLRVVGAAHFPLQGRQRSGQRVDVDLELPRSWRRLPDMPALWHTCEAALSLVAPAGRPAPAEWCARLEELLAALGASELAASVRQAQGDPVASGPALPEPGHPTLLTLPPTGQARHVPDVVVRPVLRARAPSTWQLVKPVTFDSSGELAGLAGSAGSAVTASASPRELARRAAAAWGAAHRLSVRLVRSPGRRLHGLRRLGGVLALDVAAACLAVFVVGMIVSPWIGL